MWFLSTGWSKFSARGTESRQKRGEMCDFCLPGSPKSARAASKVEQNLQNLEKCSTQLPSPEPCGLRLRANLKNRRLSVTEVRCSGWADDAQHCIWQNHCRLRGCFVRKSGWNSGLIGWAALYLKRIVPCTKKNWKMPYEFKRKSIAFVRNFIRFKKEKEFFVFD